MKPYIYFFFIIILNVNFLIAQPIIHNVTKNSNTIAKYNKLELTIELTANFNNPYDYSEINLQAIFISPSGEKDTIDGFYYQDFIIIDENTGELQTNGNPEWKIRFSPTEIGTWQYKVYCITQNGISNIINQDFECTTSNSKGYIRKANNMFMKYDDGTQFFAIGENLCWNINTTGGVNINQTFVNYKEWIDTLSAYNGNLFRVWMSDWAFALEWNDTGLRNYSGRQKNAFYLDWLIEYAKNNNTYIELCLNHHGQFVSSGSDAIWNENPYNIANGGPCNNSYDFFTNYEAKNHYKNRLRYINARWGYSTAIFAWEQFNEMDLIGDYWTHKNEIAEWTIEMSGYLKNIDVNKHLISTSFVQDNKGFDIWNSENLDYTQTHYYSADAEIETTLNNRIHNFLNEFDKPTKIGEYSLSTNGANVVISYDADAIHVHNVSWSTAFSGSFGIAMSWWWKWYINNQNIKAYKNFREVSNFISSIDLLSDILTPQDFDCELNTSSSFYIIPGFGWGVAPANNFVVNNDGSLTPSPDSLSIYLYGNEVNTELRNPPVFNVNYLQDGYFTVRTGNASEYNPIIEIWLDNTKILEQNAEINTDYTINIPAGTHQIFVDNKGHDWIKIDKYFSSFDTSFVNIKSNGLISQNAAYGWVHNRNYNWNYINENGIPTSINNAQIIIQGLNDGNYNVKFFNTFSGEQVSEEVLESINDVLYVNIPELLWDYAFKITKVTPTDSKEKSSYKQNNIYVYPNPVKTKLFISGIKNDIIISVFDICGKHIFTKSAKNNFIDLSNLKSGIYILKITSNDKTNNFKIIKK